MSDALLSPTVGGAMWAASAGAVAWSARRLGAGIESRRIPLMGVLAAFVFAGQMINFTIPGAGSSGHLGGGMILAVLLGPHAALLAMASILTVQALFFADGGLLALGCNIFNLGFFPAFVAYPLVFRPLAGEHPGPNRLLAASVIAAVAALQLGALGVVLQTVLSGISDLRLSSFAILMLPIHLAIGIIEGLVTAAVVTFVARARPGILDEGARQSHSGTLAHARMAGGLALAALVTGGFLSWFASTHPDGLEWAVRQATGRQELPSPPGAVHKTLGELQQKTSLLPDYTLPGAETAAAEEAWPAVSPGTSLSGIVGGILTLLLAAAFGYGARRAFRKDPT